MRIKRLKYISAVMKDSVASGSYILKQDRKDFERMKKKSLVYLNEEIKRMEEDK